MSGFERDRQMDEAMAKLAECNRLSREMRERPDPFAQEQEMADFRGEEKRRFLNRAREILAKHMTENNRLRVLAGGKLSYVSMNGNRALAAVCEALGDGGTEV